MTIKDKLEEIQNKILEAEQRCGRREGSVKLIAVSKFHPQEAVRDAALAGQLLFGENRVQEAAEKFPPVLSEFPQAELHIIGQLQTNKVKKAVELAACIQSVDRSPLVQEIEKQCTKMNKQIKILLEIHTGEATKSGFTSEEQLKELLDAFSNQEYPHVIPAGFMTMATFTDDQSLVRRSFSTLRELQQRLVKDFPKLDLSELSMGMSGDFETAIEEGSTMVRIGTAIFGERVY